MDDLERVVEALQGILEAFDAMLPAIVETMNRAMEITGTSPE